ncbi:hypothetical protein OSB04_018636 [Centaurea solstitialis]|uniref:TIR domain-containing protein n=1 Tax=Centaurea solstitialis TaxID=347529 RepID=A0AA38TG42_9ASTR|nr:hypothetical protein OSB04_018636 [Centaurea solstitialis]
MGQDPQEQINPSIPSSSSHSTPTPSTSSSQPRKHDVFLSFRGTDVRNTFVDHLYSTLKQKGIDTYKDDKTLPRGETIGPALLKAIEESQVAIIVFSENYADSSWCLQELAHIMKCKDERGLIVMPIFYHIDPSELRKQKGKYGAALAIHESEKKNVESWRKALVDAGNLSGDVANGPETVFIKQIVDTLSNRLMCVPISSDHEDLTGIEARLQDLKSKMEMESDGVVMVGIWGLGGGGKTTLASALYDEISTNFDGTCFLKDVREESRKHGLEKLQEKVLSLVLKQKRDEVVGSWIESRLRRKKVLMVLDDVDHLDQLKELAGSNVWFGEGSRIIITTRDSHLLNAHKVNVIYNISLLNDEEAIKLFYMHAPRNHRPLEDYERVSKDVVSYARGLPLALKVLGSFLCDKDMSECTSALARLKEIPDGDIVQKLKISYDGLEPMDKELFLDIACFFRGYEKDLAMVILDACGFHPVIGITVLRQKALITLSEEGRFEMHDLIQEMAHYIVRGENQKNPELHSRVWKDEDVVSICVMDSTKHLPNLKVLDLSCSLKLSRTPDFDGLPYLERLILACCMSLKEIHPSIGYHERIIFLDLDGCATLEIFPPIIRMKKLETLLLSHCIQLRKFPEIQTSLDNLVKLSLNNSGIETVPSSVGRYCTNLPSLDLRGCFNLHSIEGNFRFLKHLKGLYLDGCNQLMNIPTEGLFDVDCSLHLLSLSSTSLQNLLHRGTVNGLLGFSHFLRRLRLGWCNLVDGDISPEFFKGLSNLQALDLIGNDFSRLHSSLLQLPRLKFLNLSYCSSLVELPDLPSSIAILIAEGCEALEIVGDFPTSDHKWLWKVSLTSHNKSGDGGRIVQSMLKGNAVEDYFISIILWDDQDRGDYIPIRGFALGTFTLQLPWNWHCEFSGFLVYIDEWYFGTEKVIIKDVLGMENEDEVLEVSDKSDDDEDTMKNEDEVSEVSDETDDDDDETDDEDTMRARAMCYISFGSLRNTSWWNSTHDTISFFVESISKLKVELVPRRTDGDDSRERAEDITHRSNYWDEESPNKKTFEIISDSKSSIEIQWRRDLYRDVFD